MDEQRIINEPVGCAIHGKRVITFLNLTHFPEDRFGDEFVSRGKGHLWIVDLWHHASVALVDLHSRVVNQLRCNTPHRKKHSSPCKSKQNIYGEKICSRFKLGSSSIRGGWGKRGALLFYIRSTQVVEARNRSQVSLHEHSFIHLTKCRYIYRHEK